MKMKEIMEGTMAELVEKEREMQRKERWKRIKKLEV